MTGKIYYLSSATVDQILNAIDRKEPQVDISVDLNLSTETFALKAGSIMFDEQNSLDLDRLKFISKKPNKVFQLHKNSLSAVEYWDNGYYKLVPTSGAPTVEIDGVKMHRSKDIDPFIDARQKVQEVVKAGDNVLDTCGGLGYTAIWSLRLGAGNILSVEFSDTMLKIRQDNPWSREMNSAKIKIARGDAGDVIESLEAGSFDSILHDPPRLTLAGHLYGEKFYSELFRVLKNGGRLFHYTGNPHQARHGNSFLLNAAKRLKSAGFKKVIPKEPILGIVAIK